MPRSTSSPAVLLALAILGTSLLAGCTSPSGPGPAQTVSAHEALVPMREEADAWRSDAALVLISGVEASAGSSAHREIPDEQGRSSPAAPEDPSVGDGRAPTWTALFYSAAENTTRTFRYTPDGIVDTGEAQPPSSTPQPVTNWSVGSTDAVGTAMSDRSFREGALASDGMVILTLGMRGGGPTWQVTARGGGSSVQLLVDADTGALVEG